MSGIEVAGLVMGSIPLLIGAVQHYKDGLGPAKAFFKYDDELNRAIRELRNLNTSFMMTLEILLKQVADESEIDTMMKNFRHQLWKSNELEASLRDVLKQAYPDYVYLLGDIESDLKGTSNELEAIIIANAPSAPGNSQFKFRNRLKFALKKKHISRLLDNIKARTSALDELISKVGQCREWNSQKPTRKSSLSASLQQIQERATSLHQVLSRAWSCSTNAPHYVHLFLEDRMIRQKEKKRLRAASSNSDSTCFTISLSTPTSPNTRHVVEVNVVERADPTSRIVSFEASGSEEVQRIAKLPKLTDLCSVFCREARRVDCCGLGLDANGILRGVYEISRRPTQFSGSLFNMTDLLFPSPKAKLRKPLTDVDRYLIAITIASSFLQLHTTPWLNPQWSKNEILFSETVEDSNVRGGFQVDVTHPFIAQAYHCLPSSPKIQAHQQTKLDQDGSTNLLDLARLLLEIKFSYGLESLRDDHAAHNGSPQEAADPVLLTRWIKQERGNLPWAWKDAVLHCMNCSLDPDTDLQDLNVRQNILDGVVVPLVEELHYWQKGPSGGLF
ncbi:hypothetical protein NM208_g9287 [Fusarium decemcellulare]|uniref:Uncharacterized protein n=1 Tax=Fusarium decemcellulare TaxID=57161 RepID=A0ACC1S2C2_9HYPO|nr:hypothetical protein NM208_g9287 [Fusarium decemcellulare]